MTLPFQPSSDTSKAAAVSMIGSPVINQEKRVLLAIENSGELGMTSDELEQELQLKSSSVSARLNGLTKAKRITKTELTRPTRSGHKAAVYIFTQTQILP